MSQTDKCGYIWGEKLNRTPPSAAQERVTIRWDPYAEKDYVDGVFSQPTENSWWVRNIGTWLGKE